MKLILGSSSRWRRQLLEEAGYRFEVMIPDIDEQAIKHKKPEQLALAIANAKADALLPKINEPAVLITVDQLVICQGEVYYKPISAKQAKAYMESYACNPSMTVTAVVVVNTETNKRVSGIDKATVYFNPIPEKVMEDLIAKGDIFACAGGFQVENEKGELNPYIKDVEGEVDSVKGLPLQLLRRLLHEI